MRAQICTPPLWRLFVRRIKGGGGGGGRRGGKRRQNDGQDAKRAREAREKTIIIVGTMSSRRRRRRRRKKGDDVDAFYDDCDDAKKEVRVFIDCDNVRPKGTREEHCVRYVESFFRIASTYGTVTSISCYGNSNTFDREVLTTTTTTTKTREEDELCDDVDGSKKTKTKTLKKKKKSLGDVLENVRIRGTTETPDVIIKVVRTNRRAKQSADVRCMSDVVRFATATATATTSDDGDTSPRLAFIVSKDAGLLREAAGAYVKKRGEVIVCGDFLNVGMRKIDRHPIEEAYRALVEEKIDKTKGREGSEALAIELRLASWKDESVWFYSSNNTVGRRKKRNARGRWQEDPYLFVVPGPSSTDDDDDDDDDDAWLWKNCVRGLPSSIRADMRDIIDAYRRNNNNNNNNNDINSEDDDIDYSHRYEHLSQLLKREAKKKVLQVRDNSCFSYASDVLVYFDAGRLGAVFGKWLDDGNLEMVVFREEDVLR